MSDPKTYPEDSGPFHPDEVDGVDEGISELEDAGSSDPHGNDEDAREPDVNAEDSAD
ncbi:hypothetical protein [Microbacterium sp. 3J1]|uniref:hypothetical protein n=1 Tax=Microbacterium sp. 3J1 TaxID=861269 RepID=UPI000A4A0AE2|nr:hypothetical protein [Microbacterium sp. 3J1]